MRLTPMFLLLAHFVASHASAQGTPVKLTSDLLVLSSGVSATSIRALEVQGLEVAPASRSGLDRAIQKLVDQGAIAAPELRKLERILAIDPKSLSVTGTGLSLPARSTRDLDPDQLHELFALLPENGAEILQGSEVLEIVRRRGGEPVSLPPGVEELPGAPLQLPWAPPNPEGQVVGPEEAAQELGVPLSASELAAFAPCTEAQTNYRAAKAKAQSDPSKENAAALSLTLAKFSELCTAGLDTASRARILSVFGTLRWMPSLPHCGALIISPTMAITAHHCVYPRGQSEPIPTTELRFRSAAAPSVDVRVSAVLPHHLNGSGAYDLPSNDAVLLRLEGPVPTPASICYGDPQTKVTPLRVPSLWPPSLGPTWPQSVRVQPESLCKALLPGDGCFAHTCSTMPGHSGTPVLAADSGTCVGVRVVGLHVDGGSTEGTPCAGPNLNTAMTGTRLEAIKDSWEGTPPQDLLLNTAAISLPGGDS